MQAQSPALWTLVWSDEFDGVEIDRTKWTFDIGGWGWGNNELEYYTDRPENARLENGCLVIEARQETFGETNNPYTSARLKTQGLFAFKYGRVEARIKVPYGQGIWPALWTLGDDIISNEWPNCGEIDIMEHIGKEPNHVYGTIHGPQYCGANGLGRQYELTDGVFADDFHTFAVEWYPDHIQWLIDDQLYGTRTQADHADGWVFDHPFFIIMNVAVGGYWPGLPDETSLFPQRMLVDYVRVYQTVGA